MFEADKFNELKKKYEDNKLSHAFLIETNNYELCLNDIKQLLKIVNCPDKYMSDCTEQCNLCKLIDLLNLPSIIIVEPDGMSIKKQQLNELQEKFSTKPVYSRYNTYIIKDADMMNDSASNCMLKFLEEPEDNILGFFITTNKERVIDTIKSRCQIMKIDYATKSVIDEKIIEYANEYVRRILENCDLIVNKEFILPAFSTRNEVHSLLTVIFDMYMSEISEKYFPGNKKNDVLSGISLEQLKNQISIIEKTITLNQANVSLELLLDQFVIEMRRANA